VWRFPKFFQTVSLVYYITITVFFVQVIVERTSGKVLGIHYTGPNAGEVLQGYAVALRWFTVLSTALWFGSVLLQQRYISNMGHLAACRPGGSPRQMLK